jgi:hypothetical protein
MFNDSTMKLPIQFDARYGRTGQINVEWATCHGCGAHAPCLGVDSSDGEYGAGHLCAACTQAAFALATTAAAPGGSCAPAGAQESARP